MIFNIIHSLHIYKDQQEYFQTGLIALWEASRNFNSDKGVFAAYAYSFIKGRILSEMNSNNKHLNRQTYPKEEFWEMVNDELSEVPFSTNNLLTYCEHLTLNQSKWVMYTFHDMMTISEIAEREKVSIGAVKKWRKGAREKLRERICKERQNKKL
jgi:RNA polymerase sigma factor (sigma-70 family)